jgi:hypothetical protein
MIKYIKELPDDIILYILKFIPYDKLVFVNSSYYKLYHYTIKKYIPLYDNFIRDVIRRDNEYVFEQIIFENIDLWLKKKNYIYKHMIFNNFLYFVLNYCIEFNSNNCRNKLMNYLSKRDLCRNLHKKNVVKYIKWKN